MAGEVDAAGGFSRQLYKTDGTADGTHRISNLTVGLDVLEMVALDWAVVLSARTKAHGLELWAARRDSGSTSGWGPLKLVQDFDNDPGDGVNVGPLVVHENAVIFGARKSAGDPNSVVWVWREQNPTPAPLLAADGQQIRCDGSIEGLSTADRLFLVSRGEEFDVWIGNRDLSEVRPVMAANHSVPRPNQLSAAGSTLYFTYQGEGVGRELFALDAESGDIRLVADINPGTESSYPYRITPYRDGLVFNATRDDVGAELWSFMPDSGAPVLLRDFVPGEEGSRPYEHCVYRDRVYFSCKNPQYGEELWSTDGTPEGTRLERDFNPGVPDSEPYHLLVANDSLYFSARSPDTGEEIWRLSAEEDARISLATEIRPPLLSVRSSTITEMVAGQGVAYFVITAPESGTEIWATDGTESGTRLVLDLVPGVGSSDPSNLQFDSRRTTLSFSAFDVEGVRKEWLLRPSDRTLSVAPPPADPPIPHNLKGQIWGEQEIFKLDDDFSDEELGKVGNLNVFAAWTQHLGRELWVLPDHEHHPSLLVDIFPGQASGNPSAFVSTGRYVVFRAVGVDNQASVWLSDGTPGGTKSVGVGIPHDATMWDHGVAMIVRTADGRRRLMTYSPESGMLLPHLTEWQERSMNVRMLRGDGEKLFFLASHPSFGEELWCTDSLERTATRIIRDLTPNHVAASSPPQRLAKAPGVAP